jgi:hypothetical protein
LHYDLIAQQDFRLHLSQFKKNFETIFHKITHNIGLPDCIYSYLFFVVLLFDQSKIYFSFNASNPTIKNGFMMESKRNLNLIPQQYYPKNGVNTGRNCFEEILNTIQDQKIKYPLIAKPDIGLRGSGVKKINTVQI